MLCSKSVTIQANVLILKDDPEQLEQFSLALSNLGYSLQITNNTPILFMLARTTAPSLILIDINLSEIDSIEVYYYLKADRQTGKIPIIFFNNLDNLCERLRSFNIALRNSNRVF